MSPLFCPLPSGFRTREYPCWSCVCVADVRFKKDIRRGLADLVECHEKSTTCGYIFVVRIGNKYIVVSYKPAVAVDATEVGVVQYSLWLARRIALVVAIVRPHCNNIPARPIYRVGNINHYGQIATEMLGELLAVYEYATLAHYSLEVQEESFTFKGSVEREVFAIPNNTLIVDAATRFGWQILYAVR